MCLRLTTTSHVPIIAKKDILCYKVLREHPECNISSFYYTHFWRLGVVDENYQPLQLDGYTGVIYGGVYHSYQNKDDAIEFWYAHNGGVGVYECLIPKGSIIYYGVDNNAKSCFGSSKLKVVRKIF